MTSRAAALYRLVAATAVSMAGIGCGGEHHDPTPAVPAIEIARAQSRAHCAEHGSAGGVVPPARGFARVVEIPPLGKDGLVFVNDINDDGVAVGSAQMDDGKFHAFRWTERGGTTDLGAQPGFGSTSYTSAIAPDGAVSGQSDHGDGVYYGYRWTASAGRVEICPTSCSVWDLNGRGQAAGLLVGQDATTWQAFVWSAASGLATIGTLGGARSSASGISEQGLVVGNAQLADSGTSDPGHAFLYDSRAARPAIQDLNSRARTSGWVLRGASDVNDLYVVGYGVHNGQNRAFRLTLLTGVVDDLGTIGSGDSVGWAVDEAGDVVGWVAPDIHRNVATVWGPSMGKMVALNDLVDPAEGWDLQQANGINRHGVIVGMGMHHNVAVGFALTLPLAGQ
jgi:probable HAF family extracellular repeat protein